jgi:thiamine pyrophosphokinase
MPALTLEDRDRGKWEVFSDESTAIRSDAAPRVVLLAGGVPPPEQRLRSEMDRADALVCTCDAVRTAWAAGLIPDLVAGNLEGLPDWVHERLPGESLIDERQAEENDLEKAMRELFRRWGAAAQVAVLGAGTGGERSDHSLANLGVVLAEPHRRIQWVDRTGRMVALRQGQVEAADMVGSTLSILPWSLRGAIVSTVGVHYPLDEERLYLGGRGISNEIGDDIASVEVLDGVVLIWVDV